MTCPTVRLEVLTKATQPSGPLLAFRRKHVKLRESSEMVEVAATKTTKSLKAVLTPSTMTLSHQIFTLGSTTAQPKIKRVIFITATFI